MSTGSVIDDLGGSSSPTVTFPAGGGSSVLMLTVPIPATPLATNISIAPGSGPGARPTNLTVDLGAEGAVDYGFGGTGVGSVGHQDRLSDGRSARTWSPPATTAALSILLPSAATVTAATLTVTPHPDALETLGAGPSAEDVSASGSASGNVSGIPDTAVVAGATVVAQEAGTARAAVDENQSSINGLSSPLTGSNQFAQSFSFGGSSPSGVVKLASISLLIDKSGTPPDLLYIDITATTGAPNYHPSGAPLASATKSAAQMGFFDWVDFTFASPVELSTDSVYALVASSPGSSSFFNSFVVHRDNTAPDNPASPYDAAGAWEHQSADGGGVWSGLQGNDLVFSTSFEFDGALTAAEADLLLVDGRPPDAFDGINLTWSIADPAIAGGTFAYTLSNTNGASIRCALNASVDYRQYPSALTIDVNGDGSDEKSVSGLVLTPVTLSGAALVAALEAGITGTATTTDPDGNTFATVPLAVHGQGSGSLEVGAIAIDYDIVLSTERLTSAFGAYLTSHAMGQPPGTIDIPIRFTSTSAGSIVVSPIRFVVDRPPAATGTLPERVSVPEGSGNQTILDLSTIHPFVDDIDASVVYGLTSSDPNATLVRWGLAGESAFLDLSAPAALNWSGTIDFWLTATDSLGQQATPIPFFVDVTAVDDAPVFTSFPQGLTITPAMPFRYTPTADDAEQDSLSFSVTAGPTGMSLDLGETLSWTPSRTDRGAHEVNLTVSDGDLEATQQFILVVDVANHPPTITNTPRDLTAIIGTPFVLAITAVDPDSGDTLSYGLIGAPNGMTVTTKGTVSWSTAGRSAGNLTFTVSVSDGLDGDTATFQIALRTNSLPTLPPAPQRATIGSPWSWDLPATDEDGDALTYTLSGQPAGMNLDGTTVRWTPTSSSPKQVSFKITVADPFDQRQESVTVTVVPKVSPPPTGIGAGGPMLSILLTAIVLALAIALILIVRRRRGPGAQSAPTAGAPGGGAAPIPSDPLMGQFPSPLGQPPHPQQPAYPPATYGAPHPHAHDPGYPQQYAPPTTDWSAIPPPPPGWRPPG